ncbi:hypothetical protein GCM10009753_00190 [Streptantibioticus ferralitis]
MVRVVRAVMPLVFVLVVHMPLALRMPLVVRRGLVAARSRGGAAGAHQRQHEPGTGYPGGGEAASGALVRTAVPAGTRYQHAGFLHDACEVSCRVRAVR